MRFVKPQKPQPSRRRGPARRRATSACLGLLLGLSAGPALVYEPSTTLPGVTEQAALSSRLHRRLVDRFGHSLGLFEPLRLDFAKLPEPLARSLHTRLFGLDAASGYAPEELPRPAGQVLRPMRLHALGWLAAGSVLEATPSWRTRHHFFDPRTEKGLHRPGETTQVTATLEAVRVGMSSVRQLLAGAAVDGTGLPAPDWVESADNELGLPAFLAAYEQAVTAETELAREGALARALMSVGAMAAVLGQQGDPAYVHNDLAAVLDGAYGRYVADRYGRAGVPGPGPAPSLLGDPPAPARLRDLFSDGAGHGLSERTAARYYSPGALPDAAQLAPGAITGSAEAGYLARPPLKHAAAWVRRGAGHQLFLDERCHAEYAAALLPETVRFVQILLDHLLRAELRLALAPDAKELVVRASEVQLGSGTLTLLTESTEGRRKLVRTVQTLPTRPGATLASLPLDEMSGPQAQRLIVLYRGRDLRNEPVITSAQLSLPRSE